MSEQSLRTAFFIFLAVLLVCGIARIYISIKLLQKYGGLGRYAVPTVDFSYSLNLKDKDAPIGFKNEWKKKVIPLSRVTICSFLLVSVSGFCLRYGYH